ncbi:hypothetical protein L9F63_022484, partial [Diploptera punctata]
GYLLLTFMNSRGYNIIKGISKFTILFLFSCPLITQKMEWQSKYKSTIYKQYHSNRIDRLVMP